MRCDALRCRSSCSTPGRRPLVCSRAHHKLPPQPSPASQPTCLSAPPSMGRGFPSWNAGACSGTVVNGRRGAKAKITQSNVSLQASGQQQGSSRAAGHAALFSAAASCTFLLLHVGSCCRRQVIFSPSQFPSPSQAVWSGKMRMRGVSHGRPDRSDAPHTAPGGGCPVLCISAARCVTLYSPRPHECEHLPIETRPATVRRYSRPAFGSSLALMEAEFRRTAAEERGWM